MVTELANTVVQVAGLDEEPGLPCPPRAVPTTRLAYGGAATTTGSARRGRILLMLLPFH